MERDQMGLDKKLVVEMEMVVEDVNNKGGNCG